MDLQELKIKYSLLISYMVSQGYSRYYIRSIKQEINWILKKSRHYRWKTYDDIYQTYAKKWKNKYTLANRCRRLLVIKRFAMEIGMPDGSRHAHRPSNYDFLCSEFKDFIDTYRHAVKSIPAKSERTHKCVEYAACSFLFRLQKQGVSSLEQITEKNVLAVFNINDGVGQSYTLKCNVAAAFKICTPFYSECSKILSYLPAMQDTRKNIQYLTKDEIKRIKSVLEGDTALSLQNKAICLLAFYTGLRSSDIAALTLDQIDWENDLIHIIQQKTGTPKVIPLRAIVGNAIFDYITKERPKTSEKTVFLTVNAPYRRLHTINLTMISVTIMKKAGIRNRPGDRKGFHLFRHHLATSLLENGVEQPVISQTLGHQSPKSLHSYLGADFLHLKECALSIECFPVKKEVFQ